MRMSLIIAAWAIGLGLVAKPVISSAAQRDQGKEAFVRYCSSCHGIEGRGDGTVSRSLKIKPADLTELQKKNNGVFPTDRVTAAIDGRTRIEAHGESKMPVWGEIFEKRAVREKDPPASAAAKVKLIADYVATLQR